MGAYLIRRILLIFPTLFGIMLINFAVIQIVPGGPVEQIIAQMTGTAVESTARFSGAGEGELDSSFDASGFEDGDSKYRGAQGLDPDIIKEIHKSYILSGAQIIETNTFGATSIAQSDYQLEDFVVEMNKCSVEIVKDAIKEASSNADIGRVFIAGAMGPTNRTASISPDVEDPDSYTHLTLPTILLV